MDTAHTSKNRLVPALISGSTAIVLNTLALKAADLVPLATAKGGLLRLLSTWFAAPLVDLGIASAWTRRSAGPTQQKSRYSITSVSAAERGDETVRPSA
jgi:hypothetical protein